MKDRPKCITKFCRNRAATRKDKGKTRLGKGGMCHRCDIAAWRERYPTRAAFQKLRYHAKERGIEFKITLEEFEEFATKHNYTENTGNGAHCLTVDRIDNEKGYVSGNIQPLSRERNSEKRWKQDAIRMKSGFKWNNYA